MEVFHSKKASFALFLCFATADAFVYHGPHKARHVKISRTFQCAESLPNQEIITKIFTDDIPLLDVRAEVEFAKGAFPNSINIPILDDEQRHLVGTCYKKEGPKAAFDLGVELVTPVKEQRIRAWKTFSEANPTGYLYCFRGGSRSQISQAGLKEAGVDYPLVDGGYKRMRQFLIDELEKIQSLPIVMIGGRTGRYAHLCVSSSD